MISEDGQKQNCYEVENGEATSEFASRNVIRRLKVIQIIKVVFIATQQLNRVKLHTTDRQERHLSKTGKWPNRCERPEGWCDSLYDSWNKKTPWGEQQLRRLAEVTVI